MRAKGLHELFRAREDYHRSLTAQARLKHIPFHEESRYPGVSCCLDQNVIDEENWQYFVNSIYYKESKTYR